MDIICASICYRGYAEDEVQATLENAPQIGYQYMEVHGPLTWSVEAIRQFDLPRLQARLKASGMACAGLYTPDWGGKNDDETLANALAITRCAEIARELGAGYVTASGAEPRSSRGALERVIRCAHAVLQAIPADNPVQLLLEPHYGNVLEPRSLACSASD